MQDAIIITYAGEMYMHVNVEKRCEGAKKARGTAVIIDVFRAFTLEAYLFHNGCEKIILVETVQEAFDLKEEHPEYIVIGERDGKKIDGFDYGNAPSVIEHMDFTGKTVVHTTTNGVQGIMNAVNAEKIVTGSFVNAKATVQYLKEAGCDVVTLVAMGWRDTDTEEDLLCAEYLKALLENRVMDDIDEKLDNLKNLEGKKFFNPDTQDIFPQNDFYCCIRRDIFDGVIVIERKGGYETARWIER